jgi:hypothetical protein
MATSLTTDEQIKDLRVQLDRARDAQRAAEQDANDARLEAEKLSAALVEANRDAAAADDTASEAMLEAKEAKAKLEDAHTAAAQWESVAGKALLDYENLKSELEGARIEGKLYKGEVEQLNGVIGRLQAQVDEMRPRIAALDSLKAELP